MCLHVFVVIIKAGYSYLEYVVRMYVRTRCTYFFPRLPVRVRNDFTGCTWYDMGTYVYEVGCSLPATYDPSLVLPVYFSPVVPVGIYISVGRHTLPIYAALMPRVRYHTSVPENAVGRTTSTTAAAANSSRILVSIILLRSTFRV